MRVETLRQCFESASKLWRDASGIRVSGFGFNRRAIRDIQHLRCCSGHPVLGSSNIAPKSNMQLCTRLLGKQ
jgi:hypothetical protein